MWSLIIFLVFKCLVLAMFGPHTPTGGCGGAFPLTIAEGGSRGGGLVKFLVKYCNFVVNIDHSSCRRSDGRSFVSLRVFSLEGNPLLYMRDCIMDVYYFERRDCERVKRKL